MTKEDLIEAVYAAMPQLSKRQAEEAVNALFGLMRQALDEEGEVKIPRFGTFSCKIQKQKTWLNRLTGSISIAPPRRRVRFEASEVLIQRLNAALRKGQCALK
ncbi:MAG: HU family DNA-binding protein [Deltaproteobacteria bacterium]|nr:HU family DNA-binding protein [Sandaracinaceae bacterium]MCX7808420.1 HU family DNA-binding protein [Deltaproteobacteria bacterium]MDW8246288.1 HU family DNA-binding protein [Sandaracinaceae bacterium]